MTQSGRTWPTVRRGLTALIVLGAGGFVASTVGDAQKTVLDLQPFRVSQAAPVESPAGRRGTVRLVNLNPAVGAWYLLEIAWDDGAPERTYHLENPRPRTQVVALDRHDPPGLLIVEGTARYRCDLFGAAATDALEHSDAAGGIFEPLCESRLYVRHRTSGRHTRLESAADFLRQRVWGGENLLGIGHQVMGDRYLENGTVGTSGNVHSERQQQVGPLPAIVDAETANRLLTSNSLGISVAKATGGFVPGAWYEVTGTIGVYVSLLQPGMVAARLLQGREPTVNGLDGVEASALTYLIAFDLDRFEVGYARGTDHPGVGWSAHMLPQMRDARLPGPDGIGTIAPLVATGLVNPVDAARTVATFAGGFKRAHAAFVYGELATRNNGSHYGFIENGTVFSRLQPGLATILVLADGRVEMKTWTERDEPLLRRIRHARQNGVPIVEFDETEHAIVPGRLVNRWGPGNWSGAQDMKLRTIRAGAALQERGDKRFLIYAVFSTATPSAMARVFQAYQCRYAMLLDMNALEHTYFALYKRTGSSLTIEHLVKGMDGLDLSSNGEVVPRFIGYPDNRDFFYLMRRGESTRP